ncbi:uncharacterized protein B0I36DRAFT_331978 [Microdochium trichocladiopsis]|uniref:Uncharacterized protein n=1 Tax=Microdochium trichocladiopsis TaxID=1682393 RepID=A0A9P8XY71_9PEZI|nr:uncharacterized protein B0I36DRAFT_331978 [Microdochium trichocladiopsis]KAH7024740.1 hypothetical protein B0I36DRAFT_331978 [Microdochium trichocladiopsis]
MFWKDGICNFVEWMFRHNVTILDDLTTPFKPGHIHWNTPYHLCLVCGYDDRPTNATVAHILMAMIGLHMAREPLSQFPQDFGSRQAVSRSLATMDYHDDPCCLCSRTGCTPWDFFIIEFLEFRATLWEDFSLWEIRKYNCPREIRKYTREVLWDLGDYIGVAQYQAMFRQMTFKGLKLEHSCALGDPETRATGPCDDLSWDDEHDDVVVALMESITADLDRMIARDFNQFYQNKDFQNASSLIDFHLVGRGRHEFVATLDKCGDNLDTCHTEPMWQPWLDRWLVMVEEGIQKMHNDSIEKNDLENAAAIGVVWHSDGAPFPEEPEPMSPERTLDDWLEELEAI